MGTSTDEVAIYFMNSSYNTRVSVPNFVCGREGGNDFTNLNPNGRRGRGGGGGGE